MKFIFGMIVGIALVPVAFYAYCRSGRAPVAVAARPMPSERFFAKTALDAKLEREAPDRVPIQPTETNLVTGAQTYARYCSGCHGLPSLPSLDAQRMFPHPPQLFESGHMVTDDPPGESYWKVKNGIRLSAMPSFAGELSEEQMWQVALLLKNADHLPPAVQATLAAAAANWQPHLSR
jgi:thiosulfate dehydrogenase